MPIELHCVWLWAIQTCLGILGGPNCVINQFFVDVVVVSALNFSFPWFSSRIICSKWNSVRHGTMNAKYMIKTITVCVVTAFDGHHHQTFKFSFTVERGTSVIYADELLLYKKSSYGRPKSSSVTISCLEIYCVMKIMIKVNTVANVADDNNVQKIMIINMASHSV